MQPTQQLQAQVENWITNNSGLEKRRTYIGLSSVGDCSRRIVLAYYNGINTDYAQHRNAIRGYTMEAKAKQILIGAGILKANSERELQAVYSPLVKGHTEGETHAGELVEIKSMSKEKFDKVLAEGKLPYRNYRQVQAYMQHGGYKTALVFVICTETFECQLLRIQKNATAVAQIHEKLEKILLHIDNKTLPQCDCGRCK